MSAHAVLVFYLCGAAVWAAWCCTCNHVLSEEMQIPVLGIVVQALLWPLLAAALLVLGVLTGAL